MRRFLGFFLLATFFLPTTAKAELLIEPLVGYQMGVKSIVEDGETVSGGMGPAFGGRLGYQKLGFQVGVDYLNSSVDMDDKNFKKDVKTGEWGAFVGFEFPILLRVYGGYIFSITGDTTLVDETTGASLKTDLKGGSGYKAGIGFTLLPFLDINVEYRSVTVDNWKVAGSKIDQDITFNAYMVSLSLPFTL